MVTFCEITATKKKEKTFEYNNIQETPMERAIRLVPFRCNDRLRKFSESKMDALGFIS